MSKNVPKLRFPGFTEEWKNCKLGDIANFRRGSFPQPYGNPEWYDDNNGSPFIQVCDITDNYKLAENVKRKISKIASEQSVKAPVGTVLITLQGSIGKTAITQYEAFIDRTLLLFTGYKKEINKYYFMQSIEKLFNIEKEKADGGIIKTITKESLTDFKIPISSIEEQSKIADFLSTIDSRITNQSSKLDSLQELKKGVMQKIFSQEIRFKREDGGEYPKWKDISIASLGAFYNGLSGKSKKDFADGNKKYVTYMNVFKNAIAKPEEVSLVRIEENEKQNKVMYGDVIFTQSSETVEEVGMSSVWMGNEEVYLNSFCFGFRPFSNDVTLPEYLAQVLRSSLVRSRIMMEGHGTTRINLSSGRLGNVEVPIPKSIEEQQKIADFLSTLDSKIDLESQILSTLQTLKKGLLQQMFV